MTISPKTRAVIAFVLTFAAGAATMRAVGALSAQASPSGGGQWSGAATKLGLTAEQSRRAEEIFARFQPSADAVLLSLGPRLAAISDSMQAELDSILTPSQREQLRAMQRPATYLVRRKTVSGSRVDTLRLPPND
jgi:hypothetical protein